MTAESTVPAPTQQQEDSRRESTRSDEIFVLPPVDIYEDSDGLMVMADLPGVDRDSLEVRIERGILTIQGRARHLAQGDPIYREFELTGFFRQFRLPEEIDDERIEAELVKGVLRLRLYRSAKAQPRRIEVKAA